MSLKDQIANADDLYSEMLDVPEWGVTIAMRTPTVAERTAMVQKFVSPEGTPDLTNLAELYPALLIATCYDPATNEALFTAADADLIRSKNGAVVERIAERALTLAGLTDDAVPLPSGISSSTQIGSTTTD